MAPKRKLSKYNRHVQKQMKAGKTMKQAAASWSKKTQSPKSNAVKTVTSRSRASKSPGKVNKTGKRSPTLPLGLVFGLLPMVAEPIMVGLKGDLWGAAAHGVKNTTGYNLWDKKFYFNDLKATWLPFIMGIILHRVAVKFGINRQLASAGIPYIRI